MKQIILLAIINVLFLIPCLAQENAAVCPTVKFVLPSEFTSIGEKMPFAISLSEEAKNHKLQYKWIVSEGKIVEGQGTTSIKVDTSNVKLTELQPKEIIGIVQIKGLNDICENIFFEKAAVGLLSYDPYYDEYEIGSVWEERAQLDPTFAQITNDSNLVVIFYLNFKNPTEKQIDYRISRILKAFTYRKVPFENRTIFVVKKNERDFNVITYDVKGKINIFFNDDDIIKIIKGSYFKLKNSPKRK